jgi:hypothetical protein
MTVLKNAVTGALIGAVGGPFLGGLFTFLLISLIELIRSWVQQWPADERAQIVPYALILAVLVAPLCASVGALVGVAVGVRPQWFGSRLNALGFGGLVGSVAGLLVLPGLFGGAAVEWPSALVTLVTMTAIGTGTAFTVKRVVDPPATVRDTKRKASTL